VPSVWLGICTGLPVVAAQVLRRKWDFMAFDIRVRVVHRPGARHGSRRPSRQLPWRPRTIQQRIEGARSVGSSGREDSNNRSVFNPTIRVVSIETEMKAVVVIHSKRGIEK
jgi:hypothetical protein